MVGGQPKSDADGVRKDAVVAIVSLQPRGKSAVHRVHFAQSLLRLIRALGASSYSGRTPGLPGSPTLLSRRRYDITLSANATG